MKYLIVLLVATCAFANGENRIEGKYMSVEAWEEGTCSKFCGGGEKTDTRTCIAGECIGDDDRTYPCNVDSCEDTAKKCGSGVQDKSEVGDYQITASSFWNNRDNHKASLGRLFNTAGIGAWAAAKNNGHQWIQVDFGKNKEITGVATQGRNGVCGSEKARSTCPQWVKKYTVSYKVDGSSQFEFVTDENGNTITFDGNTDRTSVVANGFPDTITARVFRINPVTWNMHITMRFDFMENC